MVSNKFWHTKQPNEYTVEEWESVCTRCGKCCLVKLQDEDSDDIFYTDVICRYHDPKTNNCIQYSKRCELVPSCLKLSPQNIGNIPWIPETCAYYILAKTGTLPAWHPLITGKPLPKEFMVPANSISELLVPEEELEDHIIEDYDDE